MHITQPIARHYGAQTPLFGARPTSAGRPDPSGIQWIDPSPAQDAPGVQLLVGPVNKLLSRTQLDELKAKSEAQHQARLAPAYTLDQGYGNLLIEQLASTNPATELRAADLLIAEMSKQSSIPSLAVPLMIAGAKLKPSLLRDKVQAAAINISGNDYGGTRWARENASVIAQLFKDNQPSLRANAADSLRVIASITDRNLADSQKIAESHKPSLSTFTSDLAKLDKAFGDEHLFERKPKVREYAVAYLANQLHSTYPLVREAATKAAVARIGQFKDEPLVVIPLLKAASTLSFSPQRNDLRAKAFKLKDEAPEWAAPLGDTIASLFSSHTSDRTAATKALDAFVKKHYLS